MENVLILCTINDYNKSKEISDTLVKDKLAACVNIIPQITSIYSWKNEICEDEEYLMVIKSRKDLFNDVKNSITKLHPYEVPEIISIDITNGNEPYISWLNENLKFSG